MAKTGFRMLCVILCCFMALNGVPAQVKAEANNTDQVIRVGIPEGTEAPMACLSEEGIIDGVLTGLTEMIAEEAGVRVEFVLFQDRQERISAQQTHTVDLIIRTDMTKQIKPLIQSELLLEVPTMSVLAERPEDIIGNLAVPYEADVPELLRLRNVSYRENYLECLKEVQNGKADLTIGNAWVLERYLKDSSFSRLTSIPGTTSITYRYAAVSQNGAILIPAINQAMNRLDYAQTRVMVCDKIMLYYGAETGISYFGRYPERVILLTVCLAAAIIAAILLRTHTQIRLQKEKARRIETEESRYRVASELSNDILFEYILKDDRMKNSAKYREIFGRDAEIGHFTEDKPMLSYIHSEDFSVFEHFCTQLRAGKEMLEAEFRMEGMEGEYVWCHLRGKSILDEYGKPQRVVGKIVNIDSQKRELEKLQYKAQLDPFTGVYNKEALREIVQQCLNHKPEERYAFIMLDIDNFKHFNDEFGHLCGDRMLTRLVGKLRSVFRDKDIIGRIGGDEFVVFTKLENRDKLAAKLQRLCQAVQEKLEMDGKLLGMTVSLGTAFYPYNGRDYMELYESADAALYGIKNEGKNNYGFAQVQNQVQTAEVTEKEMTEKEQTKTRESV